MIRKYRPRNTEFVYALEVGEKTTPMEISRFVPSDTPIVFNVGERTVTIGDVSASFGDVIFTDTKGGDSLSILSKSSFDEKYRPMRAVKKNDNPTESDKA